jgi:heme-degrading monooxygenase HmoA
MAVTIVARRQASPGEGAALAAAITQLVGSPPSWPSGLRSVQSFRNGADPDLFVSLSQWDSHEAYLVSMAESAAEQLDPFSADPVERYVFRPWVAYETPGSRAVAIECAMMTFTPAQQDAVHMFVLREAASRVRNLPGFSYRRVFRDTETPNRLLIVLGWDSHAALATFVRDVRPTFDERRARDGVSSAYFSGILDIDICRSSAPGSGPLEATEHTAP